MYEDEGCAPAHAEYAPAPWEIADQHLIQHEFIKQLHARFRAENIHLL